jgi:hypothetical protein
MICAILLSGAATSAPLQQPLTDSRLKQLVMEFGVGARDVSVFRRVGLGTVLPRLASIQRKLPPETQLSYFTTLTLAYFGHDYARNVRRLTYALELWDSDVNEWQTYLNRVAPYDDMRDDVPGFIADLYRHNRDPALIRKLFSWHLDGAPAEAADAERVGLLTDYPLPVLYVIRTSRTREERALASLGDGVGADENEYRRAVSRIRQASRHTDSHMQAYTHRFLRRLAARYNIAQGAKDLRRADLARMELGGMGLAGLDLRGADLRGTDLRHTDLSGTKLRSAKLRGARYDAHTCWPAGFDPAKHGAVRVR